MSKTRPEPDTSLRSARIPVLVWVLAVLLAAGAGWGTWRYAAAPAPLGVPLPEVVEQIRIVEAPDASFTGRQMPDYWLALLAPQPDGLPPMMRKIQGARADFEMEVPFGFSQVVFSQDQFVRNGINFNAEINFDQPLTEFRSSLPKRGEMSLDEYVQQMVGQLRENKAQITVEPVVKDISGLRFRYLEYVMDDARGTRVHFAYVAPYGPYALVLDFITTPYHEELGRKLKDKIAGTIAPGPYMYRAQRIEEGTPAPGDVPETAAAGG